MPDKPVPVVEAVEPGDGFPADPHADDLVRWRGLNLLGFALMDARDAVRAGTNQR